LVRVTVVSPNHALRVGLREMLNRRPSVQVMAEAARLGDVNEKETEVIVYAPVSSVRALDLKMDIALLLITDDVESVRVVLNSNVGVWGVLPSDVSEDELAVAVLAAAEGLWVGAPAMVEGWMRLRKRGASLDEDSLPEPLTSREKEVLQHMAEGLANKQIALALGISEHTVKFHLSALYAKLGAGSRTEAVKRGIELGLISL